MQHNATSIGACNQLQSIEIAATEIGERQVCFQAAVCPETMTDWDEECGVTAFSTSESKTKEAMNTNDMLYQVVSSKIHIRKQGHT